MSEAMDPAKMPERAVVQFNCHGIATGKMRNDLEITMVKPFKESFTMATDEGAFHGGDATAPPPLAMFVGSLTGCIMTQIRAFAKRLNVSLNDLQVDTRVEWDWKATGRTYETAPKSFEIDVMIDSNDSIEKLANWSRLPKRDVLSNKPLARKTPSTTG